MIHPSYNELMKVVNNNAEYGEEPVVNSRYSIVIASAKRAKCCRQKTFIYRCRGVIYRKCKDPR